MGRKKKIKYKYEYQDIHKTNVQPFWDNDFSTSHFRECRPNLKEKANINKISKKDEGDSWLIRFTLLMTTLSFIEQIKKGGMETVGTDRATESAIRDSMDFGFHCCK